MFTFLKKEKKKKDEEKKEVKPVINSEYIQNDLNTSFKNFLNNFGLQPSNNSRIEELKIQLSSFRQQNEEIYKKIDQLNKFGFINTPSAQKKDRELKESERKIKLEIIEVEKNIEKASKLQELIDYYSLQYPTFKFINDEVMNKILHKYQLCMGDTFLYAKEIPQRALNIIEGFSKEIEGSSTFHYLIKEKLRYTKGFTYSWQVFRENYLENNDKYETTQFKMSKLKMIAPESHFQLPTIHITSYKREIDEYKTKLTSIVKLDPKTRMFNFDFEILEKNNKAIKEILDPIACLKVDGGFIILDAWDEEADIPEIKNEMLN